jgi:hypothetical protein
MASLNVGSFLSYQAAAFGASVPGAIWRPSRTWGCSRRVSERTAGPPFRRQRDPARTSCSRSRNLQQPSTSNERPEETSACAAVHNAKLTVPLRQRQPDGSGRIFPNRRAAANLMCADGPIRPSHLHHDPQLYPAPGSPDQADRCTPKFWTVSVARCPFPRKARCLRALHWPGLLAAPSMASRARVGSECQVRMIVPTCSPARAFVRFPRTSPLIT